MGLINWNFDIYQHTRIDKARDEARQARMEAASMHAPGGGVEDGAVDGRAPLGQARRPAFSGTSL